MLIYGIFLWKLFNNVMSIPILPWFQNFSKVHCQQIYWINELLRLSRASLLARLVKNQPAMRETWVQKIPKRRERLPTPIFWLGESSPWGRKESDTTERLSLLGSLKKPIFALILDREENIGSSWGKKSQNSKTVWN